MKALKIAALAAALFTSLPALAETRATGEWFNGSVRLMGGAKLLSNFWTPLTDQGQFGLLVDYLPMGFPMHLAVDIIGSSSSSSAIGSNLCSYYGYYGGYCWNSIELSVSEFNVGARKHIDMGGWRPYAGAGIGFVSVNRAFRHPVSGTVSSQSDTNNSFSAWGNTGIAVMLHENVNAGLDLRYSYSPINVYNNNEGEYKRVSVGGLGAGVFVGYQW